MNKTKYCKNCSKEFNRPVGYTFKQWEGAKFCSRDCLFKYWRANGFPSKGRKMPEEAKDKLRKFMTGKRPFDKNPFWRGGRHVNAREYILVSVGCGKRISEHRLVMEKHLGRKLNKNEHVHHKDGNRQNNALDNLVVLTASQHAKEHYKDNPMKCYWKGRKLSEEHIAKVLKTKGLCKEKIRQSAINGWIKRRAKHNTPNE